MKLTEIFPLIMFINLPHRTDRLYQAQEEFKKLGVSPLRVDGQVFRGSFKSGGTHRVADGVAGCIMSHIICLRLAQQRRQNILIFEDDVKFINDYNTILDKATDELATQNWDMLYLGGNICDKVCQTSQHLGRLSHAQSTHAYGVNIDFVDTLLSKITLEYFVPLDIQYTRKVIPIFDALITIPMIAIQRESLSDIYKTIAPENWMEERFNQQLIHLEYSEVNNGS